MVHLTYIESVSIYVNVYNPIYQQGNGRTNTLHYVELHLGRHIYPKRASNWYTFGTCQRVWHNNPLTLHSDPIIDLKVCSLDIHDLPLPVHCCPPTPPSLSPSLLFALPVSLEGNSKARLVAVLHIDRDTPPYIRRSRSASGKIAPIFRYFQSLNL